MAGSTSAHALSLPGHYVPPLPPVPKLPSCHPVLRAGAGALQGPFSKLRWNLQEDPTVRGLRTHFWEVRIAQVHTEEMGGRAARGVYGYILGLSDPLAPWEDFLPPLDPAGVLKATFHLVLVPSSRAGSLVPV